MSESATGTRTGAAWKANWDETKEHFIDWWARKGFIIGGGCSSRIAFPEESMNSTVPAAAEIPVHNSSMPKKRPNRCLDVNVIRILFPFKDVHDAPVQRQLVTEPAHRS